MSTLYSLIYTFVKRIKHIDVMILEIEHAVTAAAEAAKITSKDNSMFITSLVQTGIFSLLTMWIFRVFSKMNASLKEEVARLEKKVIALEASENKWYRKYHRIKILVMRNGCKGNNGCQIQNALDEMLSKEGET